MKLHRVILEYKDSSFPLALIDVSNDGDIYYRFSDLKPILALSPINRTMSAETIQVDHVSFHKNGETHFKKHDANKSKLTNHPIKYSSDNRIPTKDLGHMCLLLDIIDLNDELCLETTQIRSRGEEIELKMKIDNNVDKIFLRLDLLAGGNLIVNQHQLHDTNGKLLVRKYIQLANISDLTLIISLYENKGIKIKSSRQLKIMGNNQEIKKTFDNNIQIQEVLDSGKHTVKLS